MGGGTKLTGFDPPIFLMYFLTFESFTKVVIIKSFFGVSHMGQYYQDGNLVPIVSVFCRCPPPKEREVSMWKGRSPKPPAGPRIRGA